MTEVQDYSTLGVGDILRVRTEDNPGTSNDFFDSGAKVDSIREDGMPMIDCPDYSKMDSKGTGEETQILPLDHFDKRQLMWKAPTTA